MSDHQSTERQISAEVGSKGVHRIAKTSMLASASRTPSSSRGDSPQRRRSLEPAPAQNAGEDPTVANSVSPSAASPAVQEIYRWISSNLDVVG
eukprot:CAMPEP_0194764654 /NCGR_PEP_ID=MMETSP0323_2-20130528/23594_1 /TAXON_ID=2866 ORGANISM="Crypthecodinium cohnii, Strain Seligo" /NCGR_SAMPLE_ID=MMETSP0323_2 /ASSEMBLY_ACC=CAM_ASM_000346 /LENGTH=92 /DNA_ID=CAMNT_0039692393 /DNA_START=101 /DNA_END=379 /DNA_ORIENTATION=+